MVVVVAAITACAPVKGASARDSVVLWGDSFGVQVAPSLPYVERVVAGTSPCQWVDEITHWPAPDLAVLLFVGNHSIEGSCDYPWAIATITSSLRARGARVVWLAAAFVPVYPTARMTLNAWYPDPAHGPADSIGGDVYLPQYRDIDGIHLNEEGVQRFAHEIRLVAG